MNRRGFNSLVLMAVAAIAILSFTLAYVSLQPQPALRPASGQIDFQTAPLIRACNVNECISRPPAWQGERDSCTRDDDCTTFTHKECQNIGDNGVCAANIPGFGDDQCTASSQCRGNDYHFECQKDESDNLKCVKIMTRGRYECDDNKDDDCVTYSHHVCQYKKCVVVSGYGRGECSDDSECDPDTVQSRATCDYAGRETTGCVQVPRSGRDECVNYDPDCIDPAKLREDTPSATPTPTPSPTPSPTP